MRPSIRSASGAFLMLAIIPIFAGLLACMPVPVGNPERSRVDPGINGVWAHSDEAELYLFQPFDKRTWLVTGILIEIDAELEDDGSRSEIGLLENHDVGDGGITASTVNIYKAWLTKLGGETFMTWEGMGGFRDDGSFRPEYWFVFKVESTSKDKFTLLMLDSDSAAFEDIVHPDDYEGDDYVRDTRRKWERALRKNVKNPDIYTEPLEFERLPDHVMKKASQLFGGVVSWDFD